MKINELYESETEDEQFFRGIVFKYLKQNGYDNAIIDDEHVRLYHGTSESNAKKIVKSNTFKNFPWFSPDEEVAKKYSKMVGGNKAYVMTAIVKASSLIPSSGQLTARMPTLTFKNGDWE